MLPPLTEAALHAATMMSRVEGWRDDGKVRVTKVHEAERNEVVQTHRKVIAEAPAGETINHLSDREQRQVPKRIDPLQSTGVAAVELVEGAKQSVKRGSPNGHVAWYHAGRHYRCFVTSSVL